VSVSSVLSVFLGAGIGGVLRYVIGEWTARWSTSFPISTLAINVAGAFALGFLAASVAQQDAYPADVILFLGVGILGGFTTFSTLSYDTVTLFQQGQVLHAVANMFGSVVLGVTAAALGVMAGRSV
jgi:CrcB protein